MPKPFAFSGISFLLIATGVLLVRHGIKKADFKSEMESVHYRPVKNYGKGFSITLGLFCLILAIMLIAVQLR